MYRDAIAGQHDFSLVQDKHKPYAACVQLADIVARALLIGSGGDKAMPVLDHQALKLLKMKAEQFDQLFRATEAELGRAEVFFTIITG
jgi:hypothetical protein